MSTSTTPTDLYRFSVLMTASVRMWRAWRIVLPVVIVNSLAQAALQSLGVLPYLTLSFIVTSLLSFLILATAFGAVAVAMLQAVQGPVSARSMWSRFQARWLPLVAWSIALVLAATLGFALYVLPGLVIIAIFPYVLLAVLDGRTRPLSVNFRTIRARWGRWLVTIVAMAVICLVLWLLALLDTFFVGGVLGAFIEWIVVGFFASWFVCAWALIYRSVNPGLVSH